MAGSSSGTNVSSGGQGNRGPSKQPAPPKGTWAKVVSGDQSLLLAVKRMNLKFVQPVLHEGRPKVVTAAEIAVEGAKQWSSTMVGCFVGGSLLFSAVNNIARKIWSSEGLADVLTIEKGFFLFRFATEVGMTNIVEKGPWLFAGRYMVLRKWSPGLPLSKANLSRIPVWAKFHNVPIELWTEEGLSHIASAVGLPLYADASIEACSRVSFARICVEVDASVPLVDEFDVEVLQENSTSSLVTVSVSYQWRPLVSEVCKVFGHATSSCKPPTHNSSSVSLVQAMEAPIQLAQVGQVEEHWHLVERRKRTSPSRRTNTSIPSNSTNPSTSSTSLAPSSSLGPSELFERTDQGDKSQSLPISGEGNNLAEEPLEERPLSSAPHGTSGAAPFKECPLVKVVPDSSDATLLLQMLGLGEALPPSDDTQLRQRIGPDSDSSAPLLCSKLAARLKSIDGPVHLNQAAVQGTSSPLGELGKASRQPITGPQPLLLARRTSSRKGGSSPHFK